MTRPFALTAPTRGTISGVLLCLTIIGTPLGLGEFKLINVSLRPFGREIVSVDEARRRGGDAAIAITALRR